MSAAVRHPRAGGGARWPALAAAALAAALAAPPRAARAQATNGSVIVIPPTGEGVRGDTLVSVTPTFLIQAVNFGPERPLRYVFQLSRTREFRVPLVLDTLFTSERVSVTVSPPFALDAGRPIFWRATVIDLAGVARTSAVGGPLIVPPWVTPVSPPERPLQTVRTRRPRFTWRSAQVGDPPGPWQYTVRIHPLVGDIINIGPTRDTSIVSPSELEPNQSYRWEVQAALPRAAQVGGAFAEFSFFVEDSTLATSTILYQNFPNPFPSEIPTPLPNFTCIWFDLANAARVQLEIYDLRGLLVRRLLPHPDFKPVLDPGRYGRQRVEANEGCDTRIGWDGRDGRGREVPAGVYLVRFRADGIEQRRRILFRGLDRP